MPKKKKGSGFKHIKTGKFHKKNVGNTSHNVEGDSDGFVSDCSETSELSTCSHGTCNSESNFDGVDDCVTAHFRAATSGSSNILEVSHSSSESETSLLSSSSQSPPPSPSPSIQEEEKEDASVSAVSNRLSSDTLTLIQAILPNNWFCLCDNGGFHIMLMSRGVDKSVQRSVFVFYNGEDRITVHRKRLDEDIERTVMKDSEENINLNSNSMRAFCDRILRIVNNLRVFEICAGEDDTEFESVFKYDESGIIDSNPYDETRYITTFRSNKCSLLVPVEVWKCKECLKLKRKFACRLASQMKSEIHPCTANKHLTTEQLEAKSKEQGRTIKALRSKVSRLQKIKDALKNDGVKIDKDLSESLMEILRDSQLTPVQQLFIMQQHKASKCKDRRGMRWHPTMIRLALSIKSTSTAAYENLRASGVIQLPGSRTLYDYTHALQHEEGFHYEKLEKLSAKVKSFPNDYQSYHALLMDEMHISQKLVYDKSTGAMVGFVKLSEIEEELQAFNNFFNEVGGVSAKAEEPKLAKKMLAFMIKGIASDVKEVVASYTTCNLSKHLLFHRVWEVIGACERSGLKIIALVCDGAPDNRAVIDMHRPATVRPDGVVFDTVNLCAPERKLYFISDLPHLIKTIRNNFAKSGQGQKCKRLLTKGGELIVWKTIERLFMEDIQLPLRRCPKLNSQVVYLNNYTCMKVGYAFIALSNTVATDIELRKWPGTAQTVEFIRRVNNFADNLNGAHSQQGIRKSNPRLAPYTKENKEERFAELRDFEKYIMDWAKEVADLPKGKFSQEAKAKMLLSHQTVHGIKMTVNGFIGAVSFLLDECNAKFINARVFCQDPLEQYFGKQRSSVGGSSNPNVMEFHRNDNRISIHRDLNVRRRSGNTQASSTAMEISDEPLPRKRIKRK